MGLGIRTYFHERRQQQIQSETRLKKLQKSELNWDDCDPETNGEHFFIASYAQNWNTAFDIGANQGDYATKIKQQNPACRIVCFEPNKTLRATLQRIGDEVISEAVGAEDREITININSQDHTQSSIYRENTNTKAVVVHQTTLDTFARKSKLKYIDFVKIDVEGHEVDVLLGAKDLIENSQIGMLQFEYGGTFVDSGKTLKQVYEILSKNYFICHVMPAGLLILPYSSKLETYRYSNWVAIARNFAEKTKDTA
ncbi:MAG: FkbM family methyltransferase [Candidatus Saccharimonadia bacterium]